jgi:hypothetical protein
VAQIKGPITETWSFSRYFAHLKVSEAIYLHIITDCGPAHIDTKVWAKGVVKASGLLKVFLKSKGTMSSFNAKLKTALTLSAKSSSKVQVIITCTNTPPPPPTPAYSCDTLHLSVTNDTRTVTVDSFSTSQSGGATFSNADIDWGDGTQPTKAINSPVGTQHTYGGTGTGPFLAKATAHFNVNGTDQSATSSGCQQAVSFTTQKPPSCSLDTVEQPNDVLWGNTRTIKVTGTCPTGAQGTLKSSANIGSVASADQSVTVSGDFTVYVHYTAPTEGTSDTFTAKLFDSSNNFIGQKSVTFGLTQPTTDPMVKAQGGHMMVA